MKILALIMVTILVASCSYSFNQPPLQSYEYFRKSGQTVDIDIVQKDMLDCGFDNPFDNKEMLFNNKNEYVKAYLCMEQKGYKKDTLPKGICHRYKDQPACQGQ